MDVDDLCMGCFESRQGAPTCPSCGWVEGRPPDNPVHLKPRTQIGGHYVLGRVLGHGGFGIAYIAWDTNLQMKVALKEFLPGDHATRGANGTTVTPYSGESRDHFEYGLSKFLDEGRAVARFNDHPGIVPVLGFFRENGTGYLVMQYVPGMSLLNYLKLKGGRIDFAHAADIAMPVMDTLRVVHDVGLLHRDISPDNIYITSSARVKLLDFGAARHALGDRSQSLSMILKAGYAPFEQYQSRGRQGPYTDVYALAATIYRCITGEPPTEAPSRVGHDPLLPPSALGVEIPPPAEAVLMHAMAVDAGQRFQRVQDFQEALAHARASLPAPRPAPSFNDARTRPVEPARRHDPAQAAAGAGGPGGDVRREPDRLVPRRDSNGAAAAVSLADRLRSVTDILTPIADTVAGLVERTTSLRLAPDDEASARQGGLVAGAIVGVLGTIFCLSILISPSPYLIMPDGGYSTLVWKLRILGGLVAAVAMAIGGIAGLSGERRGAIVVWAGSWLTLAAAAVGIVLQLGGYLRYTAFGIWIAYELPAEIWRTVPALVPTVVVLFLLWARSTVASTQPPQQPEPPR